MAYINNSNDLENNIAQAKISGNLLEITEFIYQYVYPIEGFFNIISRVLKKAFKGVTS
jgi:hypothetical protein